MKHLKIWFPQFIGLMICAVFLCPAIYLMDSAWTAKHYMINTMTLIPGISIAVFTVIDALRKIDWLYLSFHPVDIDVVLADIYGDPKDKVCKKCNKIAGENQKLLTENNSLKDTIINLKV